ncbi:class I SAM-dependent methyltransferase [Legionella resiliens]|uniref:Class I SAM-dependent methyltransferase n=1 Tax=Legionella resiliens TaxID=2905958 RepID=A0ABS8X3A0_9GAMM|nr:class I SAM-dependent methyltransferase [Legionella sp. 9fVS26]MCE3531777.1 class I SAM-dependent methyltransferase [Legionella sp. 8cVS16]
MKNRPKHFVEKINRAYELVTSMKEGYVWRGSSDYSFSYPDGVQLNTKKIIEKASLEGDITILDIGTSNGVFISANDTEINKGLKHKHRVTVYGISATDERTPVDNNIPNEKYFTGNAEHLGDPNYKEFRGIASQQFDYIFSSKTFMHLVDPVSAIIDAYNKLKPGGTLVIDEFTLKGCEGRLQDIITHLRQQGHCVAVSLDNQTGVIHQFCIKKTDKSLEFPLEYDEHRIGYVPSPQLEKDNRSNLEKIAAARTLLESTLEKAELSAFKEFASLEALLKSKQYLALPHKQQEYCILYVVAKELSASASKHPSQLSSTNNFFTSNPISLQKILNLKQLCFDKGVEGGRILSGDLFGVGLGNILINSKYLPLATRLNLIRLTACQNMLSMDLENSVENAKAFAQMNVRLSKVDYLHNESLFSAICDTLSQPRPSQPMNVVMGRKFTENSQFSELSPHFNETLKFLYQYKEHFCNQLQIKLENSSYNFTKITCIGTPGHYSFKLLAESHYSGDTPEEFIIPASQFLAIMNQAYSTIHRQELVAEKLPLIFDSSTLVAYLNNNLGITGITTLDSLSQNCMVEEISGTEDHDSYKISVKMEHSEDVEEIMISKEELSELIQQQQSASMESGFF